MQKISGNLGEYSSESEMSQGTIEFGTWVRNLLVENDYYGTRLPRIPIMIDREIKKRLMIYDERQARLTKNLKILGDFSQGKNVRVYYEDLDSWRKGSVLWSNDKGVNVEFEKKDGGFDDGISELKLMEKLISEGESG